MFGSDRRDMALFAKPLRRAIACIVVAAAAPHALHAQDEVARSAFNEGRRLAVEGQADAAMAEYARASAAAAASGDRATATAVARGIADVYLVYRGCGDSALRILSDAMNTAAPGDRSVADAMVRLLATRGDVARARSTLVKAYEDIPNVGRNVTRESVTFLQGMAHIEYAGGREAAALSSLNSALQIATRMHEGDQNDSTIHSAGVVTAENAWVMYDIAQLRLRAKTAGIASPREAARIMELIVEAWPKVSEHGQSLFPVSRLAERLEIKAIACTKSGTSCPVPKAPKCP